MRRQSTRRLGHRTLVHLEKEHLKGGWGGGGQGVKGWGRGRSGVREWVRVRVGEWVTVRVGEWGSEWGRGKKLGRGCRDRNPEGKDEG